MDAEQLLETDGMIGLDTDTEQYLTFILAGEEYALDILRIQEIKEWDTVTPMPNTPSYIKGVSNLRGAIIPIIDLRARFGLGAIPDSATTVIIVLKVMHDAGHRTMGIVVDAVSDVYNVSRDQLNPAPELGGAIDTDFVKGLATVNEKTVIVLQIDQLLNSHELSLESCG